MKIPDYDPENITPQQHGAMLALAVPIAEALIAGIPSDTVRNLVNHMLDQAKVKRPEFR